jgi:hypothetical protein
LLGRHVHKHFQGAPWSSQPLGITTIENSSKSQPMKQRGDLCFRQNTTVSPSRPQFSESKAKLAVPCPFIVRQLNPANRIRPGFQGRDLMQEVTDYPSTFPHECASSIRHCFPPPSTRR